MKKLLALTLALIMVFALAACGNNETPDNDDPLNRDPGTSQTDGQEETPSGTQSNANNLTDVDNFDFDSIINGNGSSDVIYGQMEETAKQQFIADAAKEGYEVSFGADGSMTMKGEDGTTIIQKPDGTYAVTDGEGGEAQLGGNWPDNEFTKLVPKPDFDLYAAGSDEYHFSVAFTSATIDQIRDYVTKVKAVGFDQNEELQDQEMMGMVIYKFYAENTTGYSVEITFAAGTTGMNINKLD